MRDETGKLDVEALRAFAAAARLGNISDASVELGVSQSTVSRRIASLEGVIGAKLLVRNPNGVVPTEVGRRIAKEADGIDERVSRIGSIAEGLRRNSHVVVSASDGIGGYWLPILMAKFADEHPDVCVQVNCNNMMFSGTVGRAESDIDVVYHEPTDADAVVLGRGTLPMRMFGSHGYLERFGAPASFAELARHRLCVIDTHYTRGLGGPDWDAYADMLEVHPRVSYRVNSTMALGFAIRSGWGLGVQPWMVEVTETGMAMLPPEVYRSELRFWLVAHRDLKDNPAPRLVADWIKRNLIGSLKGRASFDAGV